MAALATDLASTLSNPEPAAGSTSLLPVTFLSSGAAINAQALPESNITALNWMSKKMAVRTSGNAVVVTSAVSSGLDVTLQKELPMRLRIEVEQEEDGRWIAEIEELPGAMVYGAHRQDAISKVQALALRVLAERVENGESQQLPLTLVFTAA